MDNIIIEEIKKEYPEQAVGRAEDLTNQCFGKQTVLYRTINGNDGKPNQVCQCSCDNKTIKSVSAKTLKAGTSTSCGCNRFETIADKADKKIHQRNEQGEIILKHCFRCGEQLPLNSFQKNKGQKDGYSGECINCQTTAKENRYNIYKKNARKRNIDFSLTKEEFYDITSKPCKYCGELNKDYNGIDRVDSNEGYKIDNCVPCCEICNKMKLDYSYDFQIEHMKKILEYIKNE